MHRSIISFEKLVRGKVRLVIRVKSITASFASNRIDKSNYIGELLMYNGWDNTEGSQARS